MNRPFASDVIPPAGVHAFFRPRHLRVTNVYYLVDWLAPDLRLLFGQAGLLPLFAAQPLFERGQLAAPRTARIVKLSDSECNLVNAELSAIHAENARQAPSGIFLKSALLKGACHVEPCHRWRHGIPRRCHAAASHLAGDRYD
ncbi:MAG: hypothetical protein SF187_27845 [Deltaproteobacteria bacterium]|nr:hypothetical protein [Deltaproteobacteria bacterium]